MKSMSKEMEWYLRFQQDSPVIPLELKAQLLGKFLQHDAGLTEDEALAFTNLDPVPTDHILTGMRLFASARRKVADVFSAPFPNQDSAESASRVIAVKTALRPVLMQFYKMPEADEILDLMRSPMDTSDIVLDIIGRDNPLKRRLRNAYLSKITDLFSIDLRSGKLTDLTYRLFQESQDDPAAVVDRFILGK